MCGVNYPTIGNIPDLRISGYNWLDHDKDLENAIELHALSNTLSLEDMVYTVFARQAGFDESRVRLRTRQVLEGCTRYKEAISGWLAGGLDNTGTVLEIGCGGGMLTAAIAPYSETALGIDISMEWLVVAERYIMEHGGTPCLAAASGEEIPLPANSIGLVASLDVIEHVHDPARYLSEIDRILKPGGRVALSTPNRYSLTAEPHVFVWGVGWIPRRWQKKYVKLLSGKEYNYTCLLSYRDLKRMIRENTLINAMILPGTVPESEISSFPNLRGRLARLYNYIHRWPVIRQLLLVICPFFQITGIKLQA